MAKSGNANIPGLNHLHVNVEIDKKAIAEALLKDPAFINAVANAVRIALTKQVRSMGNLFGQWAGK